MLGFAQYELYALKVGPAKAGDGCTSLGFWLVVFLWASGPRLGCKVCCSCQRELLDLYQHGLTMTMAYMGFCLGSGCSICLLGMANTIGLDGKRAMGEP